jgi:hypothetical protein
MTLLAATALHLLGPGRERRQGDEPFINGNSPMDLEPPLGVPNIQLSILSGTSWSSFPAMTGTIEAGGTVVLNFPVTLGLGLLTTFTLSATDSGCIPDCKKPLAYDKPGVLSSGLKIALRFSESTRL